MQKLAKNNWVYYGVIVALLLCFTLAGFGFGQWVIAGDALPVVQLQHQFIDVNGDGQIDFVVNMGVVINRNGLPLPDTIPAEPGQ